MIFSLDSTLSDIIACEKGRIVLEKHLPLFRNYPNMDTCKRMSLEAMAREKHLGLNPGLAETILCELNKPLYEIVPAALQRKALDELELEGYKAGEPMLCGEFESIELGWIPDGQLAPGIPEISLDGAWQMAYDADGSPDGAFKSGFPAVVPGSVHTALTAAGKIPDTTFGRNQETGCLESYKNWWLKRSFKRPEGLKDEKIVFEGICNKCDIWLNGEMLGSHEGMFGGPEFSVSALLKDENTLVVKLYAIPFVQQENTPINDDNPGSNISWRDTVVFNNVYGWHYSKMPSLGIWRPVRLVGVPDVAMDDPFIATDCAEDGTMKLKVHLEAKTDGILGCLYGSIAPANFDGRGCGFEYPVACGSGSTDIKIRFRIPEHKLWWPVDLGEPNLYRLSLSFVPERGKGDAKCMNFGIRKVTMAPLASGPNAAKYNWTFVINGKPHFVKGSGWCTPDALMDFSRTRYDRFLKLCRMQHVQMLRAWGSGMPETDDFYDLCDRYGIMVIQEWPTAWNSHETQPYKMMEETVRLSTIRIRNHASLVMWGAGNETPYPYGEVIDMMGRCSVELDGTRPFHRGEPWGGSEHDYSCWWGRRHLDYNVAMTADFYGEYGVACSPDHESLLRYLPDDEKDVWPPKKGGAFEYHTPIFGTADDINRLMQYAGYFIPIRSCSLREYTVASQLATATAVRHTLERARTRWPDASGALYYKINDNFPAASWSCIDWYGRTKLGHFVYQDAFEPLTAVVLFPRLNFAGTPENLPVWLLDDNDELKDRRWQVNVRIYGGAFELVRNETYKGDGSISSVRKLGEIALKWDETDYTPLMTVVETVKDGLLAARAFYWCNFEYDKGCLFRLPSTTLGFRTEGGRVIVENTGKYPAVAVNVTGSDMERFVISDNYFWLEPGEAHTMDVNDTEGISVSAWNAG